MSETTEGSEGNEHAVPKAEFLIIALIVMIISGLAISSNLSDFQQSDSSLQPTQTLPPHISPTP